MDLDDLAHEEAERFAVGGVSEGRVSTVHQQLIDSLRRSILSGEFVPGRRLRQVELAERFGVSPVPLREALRALEQEGLVVSTPRRGWIVTKLTEEDIQEIYELRELLEQQALRDAMPMLTDEDLAELERLTEQIVSTGAPEKHLVARERFYAMLYGASGKQRLASLILNLHNQLAPYLRLQRARHSADAHVHLMEALVRRDVQAAAAIISEHLADICARCIEAVQALDGRTRERTG